MLLSALLFSFITFLSASVLYFIIVTFGELQKFKTMEIYVDFGNSSLGRTRDLKYTTV